MELSKWNQEKQLVLEMSRMMVKRGLVVGTAGNISLRLNVDNEPELLAITPSSRHYDSLDIDDIQVIDFNSNHVEGELIPSIETLLHIGIYRARKGINAVIHTHSVFASVISVIDSEIPPIMEDQVMSIGGEIRIAEYTPPQSPRKIANVLKALEDRFGVLLAHHGAIGIGGTIQEAFDNCEIIEKTSKIYYLALSLGEVKLLTAEASQDCLTFFKRKLNQG
jgi:L-fuculose-phosphate aldolase